MFRLLLVSVALIGFIHPIYSQAPEKPKGRKVAFLVTVSDYSGTGLGSLENAETETQLLANALEMSGYAVNDVIRFRRKEAVGKELVSLRPSAADILKELEMTCKTLTADDTLLFIFNGHCARVDKFKDKGLMLLPEGVRLASEETMIPLSRIYEMFEKNCKAKQKLILLSPYRTDLTDDETARERLGTLFCPRIPDPPKSVVLISSCGYLEQSPLTKEGMNPIFFEIVDFFSYRPVDKPTRTGSQLIHALKPIIPANAVNDFVKGDVKDFESWVLSDLFKRPRTDWVGSASKNQRVIFEKNEPVAVFLETRTEAQKSVFSIANPLTKKAVTAQTQEDAYSNLGGFSSDGRYAVVTTKLPASILVDTKTGREIQTIKHPMRFDEVLPSEISKVCFSPNNDFILSCDRHGNAIIWDIKRKEQSCIVKHESGVVDACFLQGGLSFVTVTSKRVVQAWSTKEGRRLWQTTLPSFVECVCPSADGRYLAFGRADGQVTILNPVTGEEIWSEKFGIGPVGMVCFSPDGKYLAARGWTKAVMLRDMKTKKYSTFWHSSTAECVAFSPDGTFIATADRLGITKVWNMKSGERVQAFDDAGWIIHLAFSPDEKKLVVIVRDSEFRVWDIATGKRLDVSEKKKE